MDFYDNQLFHIYNQGNNGRKVFQNSNHYDYFLWKMRLTLPPFGSLISYCLMPNHFHWQFYIENSKIKKHDYYKHVDELEYKRRDLKFGTSTFPMKARVKDENDEITLNHAIGILLRSYTRKVNLELNESGSLFRSHCKAKDGWIDDFITIDGKHKSKFEFGNDYVFQCFSYIHENPVKAGLVKTAVDWEYSSAKAYNGFRNNSIVNIELGKELFNNI
ncbi:hypothetical protein [Portibacter lacus]|uniref:Transposase IS200-like domain-containing protein n=1 Tax=Portibacter lacus TaxID=1099794 RepID=A0AA37SRX7_9BACT|nr:hypothetical protein [Portibacter lacus]GLR18625.1 hypothetical protein GCM10007940_32410 [Portibacter lacus]